MTTETAIDALVTLGTLPPQIDYREKEKRAAAEAEAYLDTLPVHERQMAYLKAQIAIDSYYTPTFQDSDGRWLSVADLDAMF